VKGVGDVAQAGEAGGGITAGFVPLDLLFGDAESGTKIGLGPASSDPGFDQRVGQLGEGSSPDRAGRAVP